MIRARRLFLIPILFSPLLLTVIGIPFYIMICFWWVHRNPKKIVEYAKGNKYEQTDIRKEELEELR